MAGGVAAAGGWSWPCCAAGRASEGAAAGRPAAVPWPLVDPSVPLLPLSHATVCAAAGCAAAGRTYSPGRRWPSALLPFASPGGERRGWAVGRPPPDHSLPEWPFLPLFCCSATVPAASRGAAPLRQPWHEAELRRHAERHRPHAHLRAAARQPGAVSCNAGGIAFGRDHVPPLALVLFSLASQCAYFE